MGGLVSSLGPPSEVWESGLEVLCSMLAAPTHMYVNYIHCMYPPSLCKGVTVLATAKNLKCKVGFQNSHCIITARHLKQLPHPNEKLRFSRAPGLSLNHEALLQHISSFFFLHFLALGSTEVSCFVLQPEWTSQREPSALGSHLHQ